jgi:hypothetical protein
LSPSQGRKSFCHDKLALQFCLSQGLEAAQPTSQITKWQKASGRAQVLLGSTGQAFEVVVELLDCDSSALTPIPGPFMTEDQCTARDIGYNPFSIKKQTNK